MAAAKKAAPAATAIAVVVAAPDAPFMLEGGQLESYNALCADAKSILEKLGALTIKTQEDAHVANQLLDDTTKALKSLDHQRQGKVKPLDDMRKTWQRIYRTPMDALEQVEAAIRDKIRAYLKAEQDAANARRMAQEAIARKAQEDQAAALQAAAAATTDAEAKAAEVAVRKAGQTAEAALVKADAAPIQGIKGPAGTTGSVMVPKWKLDKLEDVPREYLKLDEVKVAAAVRAGAGWKSGVPPIPGIQAWEELDIRHTSRR